MDLTIVDGNLLEQKTEAIVNPWNRNIIPWWLLVPHGVSGAIKRQGGIQPFCELSKKGAIQLGAATYTSAGRLPYRAIIHVASVDIRWKSSTIIIQNAVKNAVNLAGQINIESLAFPLLGTGSGKIPLAVAEKVMIEALATIDSTLKVVIVRYSQ
nr:macro domain-containing protein [Oscillochloris trichoides]